MASSSVLSEEEIQTKKLRAVASERLNTLRQEVLAVLADDGIPPPSWIRGGGGAEEEEEEVGCCSEKSVFFDHTGFLHLPAFADAATTCQDMKEEMAAIVESDWHPEDRDGLDSFGTGATHNTARGDYFLESADKIHFFAEPDALVIIEEEDEEDNNASVGNGNGSTTKIKQQRLHPKYRNNNKICALNKSGHALHLIPDSIFHKYCLSEKVRTTVMELGWKDPVVPQSMYIFKQAKTGGAVNSHQDSTFLFTTPKQTCLGLWLALDDATLENGCLWVRPKSHLESVRRQYKRNVEHFGTRSIASRSYNVPIVEAEGDQTQPKFVMDDLVQGHGISWDGDLPKNGSWEGLVDAGFIPIECQAGDLLVFCGELDHLSLSNTSNKPRHTFQLHLIEGPDEGIVWSEYNWLQYPDGKPFLSLLSGSH